MTAWRTLYLPQNEAEVCVVSLLLNPFASRLADLATSDPGGLWVQDVRAGRRLTFQETAALVHDWHQVFRASGLIPGQRVALRLPNSLTFAVLYLALLTYGATVVPLNPAAPAGEVARLLQKASASLLLSCQDEDEGPCPVWVADPLEPGRAPADRKPVAAGPGRDPATGSVLLYTSGTTGEPKGVRLDSGRLAYQAQVITAHHRFAPGDVGYSSLPLFHINAQVVGLLTALTAGSAVALDDRFHASDFWAVVTAVQPTWVNAVPTILGILAQGGEPVGDVSRIRFVRSASAPLPVPVLNRFERRFGLPIVETYGLTEAASQVAANPVPPGQRKPGSVGRPVGVVMEIVDEDGRPVPVGQEGEVRIRGRMVVRGYLNSPGVGPFRQGWFYTGDHGHMDEDGYVFLTGRTRELINRGGQKVSPREVEDVLLLHPQVRQAAVIGIPHAVLGEEVAAYVVAPESQSGLVQELEQLATQHLSPYKRPVRIVTVNHLPIGPTGKIQRLSLKRQVLAGSVGGAS
jgi:acyl-CoA synthetase (AMP-forming)/AMP-acid ligase II